MIRILLTYVIPLLLPTLMYFTWMSWVNRKVADNRSKAKQDGLDPEQEENTHVEDFDIKTPWFRLILAGVVLMTVGLVMSVFVFSNNEPGSVYQAPYQNEDGTIVPGQFVPPATKE